MNIMLTDSRIWQLASQQHYVTAGVDVVLFVLGALTIFITNSINNRLKKAYAVTSQLHDSAPNENNFAGLAGEIATENGQNTENVMLSKKVTVEQK